MEKILEFRHDIAVLPALLTPFDEDGEINFEALQALIDKVCADGVDGIYACGSTAEAFLLSRKERKKLLEVIVKFVGGRVPIIAQVGSTSPREAIKLGQWAEDIGVSAISAVPPFYYHYTMQEIKDFYLKLANYCELPVLVYNVSAYTGVELNADNAADLINDARILGVKHTSYNLYELNRFKTHCPGKMIFNGHDECMLGGLAMGADGAIGSTFNDIGAMACQLRDLFCEGRMDEAMELQNRMNRYVETMIEVGVTRGIKYSLARQGIPCGDCREPNAPLEKEQKKQIDEMLESIAE